MAIARFTPVMAIRVQLGSCSLTVNPCSLPRLAVLLLIGLPLAGKRLCAGYADGGVRMWDLKTSAFTNVEGEKPFLP